MSVVPQVYRNLKDADTADAQARATSSRSCLRNRRPPTDERQADSCTYRLYDAPLEQLPRGAAGLPSAKPRPLPDTARTGLPGQGAHRVPGRQHDRLGIQSALQASGKHAPAGGDLEDVLAEP
jgi:hypothetical protein